MSAIGSRVDGPEWRSLGWEADVDITPCARFIIWMELDLFDAMRLHRVVEFDVDDANFVAEPYALNTQGDKKSLRAFVIDGPSTGWIDFPDWKNLRITRTTFTPRA